MSDTTAVYADGTFNPFDDVDEIDALNARDPFRSPAWLVADDMPQSSTAPARLAASTTPSEGPFMTADELYAYLAANRPNITTRKGE